MAANKNNGWQTRGWSLGNPIPAAPAKAVDVTQGNALHVGFEVLSGFVGPVTIEFWSYPPLAGSNNCSPNLAAGAQITEAELCDITGQTLVVDAVTIPAGTPAGSYVWARPRCFPNKFLGIVPVAGGDYAHVSAVAVFSELK